MSDKMRASSVPAAQAHLSLRQRRANKADGQPVHIGGIRGLVERNTTRHFLAIEAFLGAMSAPAQARPERRLRE